MKRKITEVKQELETLRQEMKQFLQQYSAKYILLEKELDVLMGKPAPLEFSQADADMARRFGHN